MFEIDFIEKLVRPSLRGLQPYSTGRPAEAENITLFLDSSENSLGSPAGEGLNHYPDSGQQTLKTAVSRIKGVPPQNIFLGNGSTETIDLLIRIFCEPGKDNVIVCPPTYNMYAAMARINNVEVKEAVQTPEFDLDVDAIEKCVNENTKLIFICSPNNPTGNAVTRLKVETLLTNFNGLVVVDEAFANYSRHRSFIAELTEYSNLVVLQTFSKAWGMASLRLGVAFASQDIIDWFNRIKPPYNISGLTQQTALQALNEINEVNDWIKQTVKERNRLEKELASISAIEKVYPSDANFLMVKCKDAVQVYRHLIKHQILVLKLNHVQNCEECLRITVAGEKENNRLIEVLKKM